MYLSLLIKGIIIGFSIALPVGPVGILCINSTLNKGKYYGLSVGLGAAVADAMYAAVGSLGLSVLTAKFINYSIYFRIIGSIFIVLLGIKIFTNKPKFIDKSLTHNSDLFRVFVFSLFFTLASPVSIFSYMFVFSALGLVNLNANILRVLSVVTGVFAGSIFWWVILTNFLTIFREKINSKILRVINYISGLILVIFGFFTFVEIFN